MTLLYAYLLIAIVLDHAHLVSPIGLAWSDASYRHVMLEQWCRFIALPIASALVAVVVGITAPTTHTLPPNAPLYPQFWRGLWHFGYIPNFAFWALSAVYYWWNAWHFGSQHFGVAMLLRWRRPRWLVQAATVVPTITLLVLPFGWLPLVVMDAVISFAHWVTDLGLSARAFRRAWWAFLAVALAIGLIGFLWKVVAADPRVCGSQPMCTALRGIPALLALRYSLGFIHFIYSAEIWRGTAPFRAKLMTTPAPRDGRAALQPGRPASLRSWRHELAG